jgi:Concanavalin A-like lectin/glucanases superfamily
MTHRPWIQFLSFLGTLAALAGSAQLVSAQTAVLLDGSDDHVSLPSGTIPVSNLTIAMWVNPASLPPLPSGVTLASWGPQTGCFPSTQYLHLFRDHVEMFTGCAEELRLDGPATLVLGAWQHVALSIDDVGNDVLYFNGVQVATGNSRGSVPVVGGNDVIGAAWSAGFMPPELHFPGAIDEVQIYSRVLGASEVSELFDAGGGRFGSVAGGGLVAGYHFDEGSGSSAADFSGNGKTASLVNGAGWTASTVAVEAAAFAEFSAQVTLRLGPMPAEDTVGLRTTFSLNKDSDGIDPLTDDVRFQVGTFSTTIPAGSFRGDPNGHLEFEGVIGGIRIKAILALPKQGEGKPFSFDAFAKGADLAGTVFPLSVGLAVGDDHGRTTLR